MPLPLPCCIIKQTLLKGGVPVCVFCIYPLDLQRDLAAKEDVLMDGRDIGTNILPHAQLKIYLTASVETRAKRRFLEQQEKGDTHTLEEIEEEIRDRDQRDMSREIAPLRQAEDAILVDSSDLSTRNVNILPFARPLPPGAATRIACFPSIVLE